MSTTLAAPAQEAPAKADLTTRAFNLPRELDDQLREAAFRLRTNVSEVIREALIHYLKAGSHGSDDRKELERLQQENAELRHRTTQAEETARQVAEMEAQVLRFQDEVGARMAAMEDRWKQIEQGQK